MQKEIIGNATLYLGDSQNILADIDQVHSVVTDPPYGLSFMGNAWDYDVPKKELWQMIKGALLAGGQMLSFGGTRTYHRMAVEIEDAGFEIRDQIQWLYGTGFPKSHDVSKALDKAAGAKRTVISEAATDEGRQWEGWGTALKPASEPICLARKPLDQKTIAANVLTHGTGALNIDGCRVPSGKDYYELEVTQGMGTNSTSYNPRSHERKFEPASGRWPANVIHDGSEAVVREFPQSDRTSKRCGVGQPYSGLVGSSSFRQKQPKYHDFGDEGSAARFFYCAKPSKRERGADNLHPTVKPIDLMGYLCRLITPPRGIVLDPFMGSGTTGLAALREGFGFVGIERDEAYFEIAVRRMREAANHQKT